MLEGTATAKQKSVQTGSVCAQRISASVTQCADVMIVNLVRLESIFVILKNLNKMRNNYDYILIFIIS